MKRCSWVNLHNPLYVVYHDTRWGKRVHDDRELFAMLALESFQAGLSWECILKKEEAFRTVFDGFNPSLVARFDESKVEEMLQNKAIVRSRSKIMAVIKNASVFLDIVAQFGSFEAYLVSFAGELPIYELGQTRSQLSDEISKDLYRRGMRYVGSVIIYSYLQAIGIINSHEEECFLGGHHG